MCSKLTHHVNDVVCVVGASRIKTKWEDSEAATGGVLKNFANRPATSLNLNILPIFF